MILNTEKVQCVANLFYDAFQSPHWNGKHYSSPSEVVQHIYYLASRIRSKDDYCASGGIQVDGEGEVVLTLHMSCKC